MNNKQDLVQIYVATHSYECKFIDKNRVSIQVGAVNNTKKIADIQDNSLENISKKNKTYCELTALYWIWKNSNYRVVGLEHYRRQFDSANMDLKEVLKKNEVIIPEPYYYRTSIEKEYKRNHISVDWDCMVKGIEKLYPEYLKSIERVFKESNKIYPYNMFIAEYKFVDEYCTWLFPLLEYIENRVSDIERDNYQKRFIGFLSERLFTLYIEHNRKKYIICKVKSPDKENIIKKLKYRIVLLRNKLYYSLSKKYFGGN